VNGLGDPNVLVGLESCGLVGSLSGLLEGPIGCLDSGVGLPGEPASEGRISEQAGEHEYGQNIEGPAP
jgi:hypothetical protein